MLREKYESFKALLKYDKIAILANIDINSTASLKQAAFEIKQMILNATVPENIDRAVTNATNVLDKNSASNFRLAFRKTRKISSPFTYVPARCRGEPYVRPRTNNAFVPMYDGRT